MKLKTLYILGMLLALVLSGCSSLNTFGDDCIWNLVEDGDGKTFSSFEDFLNYGQEKVGESFSDEVEAERFKVIAGELHFCSKEGSGVTK